MSLIVFSLNIQRVKNETNSKTTFFTFNERKHGNYLYLHNLNKNHENNFLLIINIER